MASKRKEKKPGKKKKDKKKDKKKGATTKPPACASKPTMDGEHAKQIAGAEKAIKLAESRLAIATADKKNATEAYNMAVDRLRKLAEEVTEKGLWNEKTKP